jgi:hypothetical protein
LTTGKNNPPKIQLILTTGNIIHLKVKSSLAAEKDNHLDTCSINPPTIKFGLHIENYYPSHVNQFGHFITENIFRHQCQIGSVNNGIEIPPIWLSLIKFEMKFL